MSDLSEIFDGFKDKNQQASGKREYPIRSNNIGEICSSERALAEHGFSIISPESLQETDPEKIAIIELGDKVIVPMVVPINPNIAFIQENRHIQPKDINPNPTTRRSNYSATDPEAYP